MTPHPWGRRSGALLAAMTIAAGAQAATTIVVADFNSSEPATIKFEHAPKVAGAAVARADSSRDGSPAVRFSATLDGPDAGWAGIGLPVARADAATSADHVTLDIRRAGNTRDVFVTLTEQDGARWNANIRATADWRPVRIPLYQFSWFEGPEARKSGAPQPGNLKSIDLWVGNRFPGAGGFDADNVALVDDVPDHVLSVVAPDLANIDTPVQVRVEARATTGGPIAPVNSELFVEPLDRNAIHTPRRVAMKDGVAAFEAFPRRIGAVNLHVHEPFARQTVEVPLSASSSGLSVDFSFESEGTGEQVITANSMLRPRLKLAGETSVPLSAHLELRDHRGRRVLARNMSVGDLTAGNERIRIPYAGLFDARVTLVAEPLAALPRASETLPVFLGMDPQDNATTAANIAVPDGITTDIVVGFLVQFEDLPATATVIGGDRFTVWSLSLSPREQVLYSSPFGICSGALFHLSDAERGGIGTQRLRWHRLLGSRWGRNDFWWHDIQTSPTATDWTKADQVIEMYRSVGVKLCGILCYEAAWSPGKSPADTEARAQWMNWVGQLVARYRAAVPTLEVWNEPNHRFWKPAPDPLAYRELLKATHEAVRNLNKEINIVGGATAGYDPVFLRQVLADGYGQFIDALSFHPYPLRYHEGPEDNDFGDVCDGMRQVMRENGLLSAGKELWITEIGWPTRPGAATEEQQANWLTRAYAIALTRDLTKVYWFNLQDGTRFPWEGDWDAHLGLLDSNYRPKPAAVAYNILQFMLCRTRPIGESTQGAARLASFAVEQHSAKWPGRMHVAWTRDEGQTASVEIDASAGGGFMVIDYLGAEITPELLRTQSADGVTTSTYRVPVTHEPVYIWDVGTPPPAP